MIYTLPPGRPDGKGEWILDSCPKCGRADKCYWNPIKELGCCFAGDCGLRIASAEHLAELCGGGGQMVELEDTPRLPGGNWVNPSAFRIHAWDVDEARAFLRRRGVTEDTARSVPIWWAPDRPGIAVQLSPLSREYPDEAYAVRYAPLERNKWMSPGVRASGYAFGFREWVQRYAAMGGKLRCLVVEGIFDLLATGLHGYGVAALGVVPRDAFCVQLARLGAEAVIWLDPDKAGREGAVKALEKLRRWGVRARVVESDLDPKHYRGAELQSIREALTA